MGGLCFKPAPPATAACSPLQPSSATPAPPCPVAGSAEFPPMKSKPAVVSPGSDPSSPEWNQVFALGYNKETAANSTLEISAWDGASEKFLGGVCFDLSDVPVRNPPDGTLAPQWYHLEGGAVVDDQNRVSGDLQLSAWIGTQADDAFPAFRHLRSNFSLNDGESSILWEIKYPEDF